jgi:hypothetical protein
VRERVSGKSSITKEERDGSPKRSLQIAELAMIN